MLTGCVLKDSPERLTMPGESFHLNSPSLTWPQLEELSTFHESTSLLLFNALPLALSINCSLKPNIVTPVWIQGLSLHWWTWFAGQGPPFLLRCFHLKKTHWKTVNECFLPSLGNTVLKWCTIKTGKQTYFRIPKCSWEALHFTRIHSHTDRLPQITTATAPRQHTLTPKPHSLLSPTEPTDRCWAEPSPGMLGDATGRDGQGSQWLTLNSLWVLERWSTSKTVPKSKASCTVDSQ